MEAIGAFLLDGGIVFRRAVFKYKKEHSRNAKERR
jgi:hypothetical protein